MKIHINRKGETIGQFEPEEVKAGIAEGRFYPGDLCWFENMVTWVKLEDLVSKGVLGGEVVWSEKNVQPVWEKVSGIKSFFSSSLSILTQPSSVFSQMPAEHGAARAFVYWVIGGGLGLAAALVFNSAMQLLPLAVTGEAGTDMSGGMFFGALAVSAVCGFFGGIVAGAIGIFLAAGVTHLFVMIFGGGHKSFWTTFKVICYATGATSLLWIVPFCGGCVAGIWYLVVEVIALKEAHRITTLRALIIVFAPIFLCCICAGGLLLAALAAGLQPDGLLEILRRVLPGGISLSPST